MPERFWATFSADTEEDLATGRTITRRSPGGPAVPKANLNRKGMAWRWRDFSVGLYVPLLEFSHMMASRHVELRCPQVPFAVYILITDRLRLHPLVRPGVKQH